MKVQFISLVDPISGWAGSEEMWLLVAKTALAKGYKVVVNASPRVACHSELQPLIEAGCVVQVRAGLNGLTRRLAAKGIWSRFSLSSIDSMDANFLSMGCISDLRWTPDLMRAYFASKCPWIIIVQSNAEHFVTSEAIREDLRRIYAKAKKVVFVSEANLKLAERQLSWRFPNAVVMPNPIRKRLEQPLPWPKYEDGIVRMAQVGRLDVFQKRQDVLLEALAEPEIADLPWRLDFYGSGPDKKHIETLIKMYGLEKKVFLCGHVRDFTEIWKNHHLHIFTTGFEGMSLALIESMFCGRPAIVTDTGGNAELITDMIEGFISEGNGSKNIVKAFLRAWLLKANWEIYGKRAFESANFKIPNTIGERLIKMGLS